MKCLTIPVFFSCSSAAVDLGGVWGWDTQRADSLFGSLEDNAEDVVLCLDGWSCSEGARNPMRGEPGGSAQGQHSMYNHILVIGQKPALKLFSDISNVFFPFILFNAPKCPCSITVAGKKNLTKASCSWSDEISPVLNTDEMLMEV